MSNDHPDDPGHGDSIAAWTAVVIILLAVTGGCVALWFDQVVWMYVSGVVAALGVVVGIVLAKLGFGVKSK